MIRRFCDRRCPVFHRGLITAFALAFAGAGLAVAQQTIYVGGGGKNPVEVYRGAIRTLSSPTHRALSPPAHRTLLSPAHMRIVPGPPGQAPRSAFLLGTSPATTAEALIKPSLVPPPPVRPVPEQMPALPPPALPAAADTVLEQPPEPLTQVAAEPTPEPLSEPVLESAFAPLTLSTAEPAPEPRSTDAAPTSKAVSTPSEILSIPFADGSTDPPDGAADSLRIITEQLAADDGLRAEVKAYAGVSMGSSVASARRLSLSRALAVRSILIDFGVRSTRIDVRALGNRNEGGGAPDRVDVLLLNR